MFKIKNHSLQKKSLIKILFLNHFFFPLFFNSIFQIIIHTYTLCVNIRLRHSISRVVNVLTSLIRSRNVRLISSYPSGLTPCDKRSAMYETSKMAVNFLKNQLFHLQKLKNSRKIVYQKSKNI